MAPKKAIYADDLLIAIRDDLSVNSSSFAAVVRHINAAPAVIVESNPTLPNISNAARDALVNMGQKAHGEE